MKSALLKILLIGGLAVGFSLAAGLPAGASQPIVVPVYETKVLTGRFNKTLKVSVTPIRFEGGKWQYRIDWSRKKDEKGSLYLSYKKEKEKIYVFKVNPADPQGSAVVDLLPNTKYLLEFYAKPDAQGKRLFKGSFRTLKIPKERPQEPITACDYPETPAGCRYVPGPEYNPRTNCGLVLQCAETGDIKLKLLFPNGGETWPIGSSQTVKWESNKKIPSHYRFVLYLTGGPTDGHIATFGPTANNKTEVKVPEHIFSGDAGIPLKPGKYYAKLELYNGPVCLGICTQDRVYGKLVAADKSDTALAITALTITGSAGGGVPPTSTSGVGGGVGVSPTPGTDAPRLTIVAPKAEAKWRQGSRQNVIYQGPAPTPAVAITMATTAECESCKVYLIGPTDRSIGCVRGPDYGGATYSCPVVVEDFGNDPGASSITPGHYRVTVVNGYAFGRSEVIEVTAAPIQ